MYNLFMFLIVILIMIVTSFLLAVLSLRNELKKPEKIKAIKRELMKEKVLFIKD